MIQVTDLATALGWEFLHVRRTKGKNGWCTSTNIEAWPDLFLFHPRHGFAGIELKSAADHNHERLARQRAVLARLDAAGAKVLVAWPHQLDQVRAILQPPTVVEPPQ